MSQYGEMAQTSPATGIICDLRSDTVTQPDAAMRAAIAGAKVGDDVYGEDTTILALEARMAEMLDKEAAVFFPTGTQSNLAAVMAHCGRGDEVIVGNRYHIFCDEAAGASVLAGVSLNPVAPETGGELAPATIAAAIKDDDPHYARSRLLCLENTVGGQAIPIAKMQAAAAVAWDAGLSVHLDGARFFNAITNLGCDAFELSACADSISVCLSKGLGAPAGSILVGSHALMSQARRNRKILGGAMRQSGVLAAAALHALDHNIPGLAEDHMRATKLAEALQNLNAGDVRHGTNMVFLTPKTAHHRSMRHHMAAAGILIGGQTPTIRMVLHRDVTDKALNAAIAAFESYFC